MSVAYQRPASLYKAGSPISNAANQIRPGVRQSGALTQTVRGTRFTDTRVSPGRSIYNSPNRGLQTGGVAGQPAPYSRLPVKGPNLSASQERAFSGFNNKLPSWADPKSPATVNPNPAPTPKPPPIQSVAAPSARGIPLGRLAGLGIGSALAGGLDVARRLNEGQSISEAVTGGAGTGLGSLAGSALGGALGSALGPIGTLAGAGLGGALGGLLGGKAGDLISGVDRATDPQAPKIEAKNNYNKPKVGEEYLFPDGVGLTFYSPNNRTTITLGAGDQVTRFWIVPSPSFSNYFGDPEIPVINWQTANGYSTQPFGPNIQLSTLQVFPLPGKTLPSIQAEPSSTPATAGGMVFVPQLNPQQFPASTPQITGPQSPRLPRPVFSPKRQREAEIKRRPDLAPLLSPSADPRVEIPVQPQPGREISPIQPQVQRTTATEPSTNQATQAVPLAPGAGLLIPNARNPNCIDPCQVATLDGLDQIVDLLNQSPGGGIDDCCEAILSKLSQLELKIDTINRKLGPEIEGGISNQIYKVGAVILQSLQQSSFSMLQAQEVVGSWVARIGNALRKYGAVWEGAFGWVNPDLNFLLTNPLFSGSNLNRVQAEPLSAQAVQEVLDQEGENLSQMLTGANGNTDFNKPKPGGYEPLIEGEAQIKQASLGAVISKNDESKPGS